ncbi:MAG: hypothetical protein K2X39_01200, partial [Silvanigrellaceae bacterium]|nr:hypothetical protein [Silvanigrellaceae bacterium]
MTLLAPTSLTPMPLVSPHDPDYQASITSIKQQMSAYADYKEGKTTDGFSPFILDGTFPEGEIHLPSGETRRIKTTLITAINPHTIDKIDLIKAIKEKRFAALY